MEVIALEVGQLQTNCYLLIDSDTSLAAIIDPGDDADFITETIIQRKLTPTFIVLTHGHFDHCLAVLELKLNFNIPVYLNEKDMFLYQRISKTALHFTGIKPLAVPKVDYYLKNKDILTLGNQTINVIATPGHTPGSVCLLSNGCLFTGDTLFSDSVGDTTHSYSSKNQLRNSLNLLRHLPKNTIIYPGHGASETIDNALKLTTMG